tara:strand:- start:1398 stop:1760 length:363 start_codon:yes stop_codon:yes gene_type:complete
MPGKHYDNMKPEKRGPYLMKPGENSMPSKFEKVNFRDSDLKKAEGFPNMYPQNFNAARVAAVKAGKDSFNVGGKEFKVTSKAGAEMHHAGLYKPEMKPMKFASDAQRRAAFASGYKAKGK